MNQRSIKNSKVCLALILCFATAFPVLPQASACTRLIYQTGNGTYITGRTMDWMDPNAQTALWVFPRGMKRDGGIGANPIKWTSKFGSISTSFYDIGTADGMSEKGLVVNLLYLKETDWGKVDEATTKTLSVGAWGQYFLDNYATVEEAVKDMSNPPFGILAPALPNGHAAGIHMSISDANGDSAILEYIDGKLVIHHSREHVVMTNSPTFDQQLALNIYWEKIGGDKFLPGTITAADRFVRTTHYLNLSPKYKDPQLALGSVFSQIRAVSVPLGMSDANNPNISMTLGRTVADHQAKIFYFESAIFPAVSWIDMSKVDFSPGASPKTDGSSAGIRCRANYHQSWLQQSPLNGSV